MTSGLIHLAPYFAALVTVAAVLIWLNERAERHTWDADEAQEQVARVKANMPADHPERLTALLSPTNEWTFASLAERLGPEVTP